MENYLGLPVDASAHGPAIDRMMGWVHWLMLVLFVGWAIYFVWVLFRFRAKRQPVAIHEGTKTKLTTYVEVAVAIVEGVLLVGFAVPIWAQRVADFPPEEDSTVVRVVARQFNWSVHYAGADGIFGFTDPALVDPTNSIGLDRTDPGAQDDIVTINEMRVPVDKPVIVHLSSLDVIHSFNLPQMRVKQDAIPGMSIPIHFTPTMLTPEGETWNIACAQLCGNSHYSMRGRLTVDTQEGYEAWLAEKAPKAPAPALAPAAAEPAEGEGAGAEGEPAAASEGEPAAAAHST